MSADVNPGAKVDLGNDQQIAFVMNPGSDHITRTDLNVTEASKICPSSSTHGQFSPAFSTLSKYL